MMSRRTLKKKVHRNSDSVKREAEQIYGNKCWRLYLSIGDLPTLKASKMPIKISCGDEFRQYVGVKRSLNRNKQSAFRASSSRR